MNRDAGLEEAINAAGGVGALARALGIAPPSVCTWSRVPPERVIAVESLTGVARWKLRPDLYPENTDDGTEPRDEVDLARSRQYALLAALLLRAPDSAMLAQLTRLQGTPTPLGLAQMALGEAAMAARVEAVQREYFELFIGVGRGELLPYASYYLTGFLNDRPLARLREDLKGLGLQRAEATFEPEDHLGTLCEIMSGLADGRFGASAESERGFFARHLLPWAGRFFLDLEMAKPAKFYSAVGALGRTFIEIESEAFRMEH